MSSVDVAEVAKFGRLAARWWDPAGPMRPLHAMNPLRVGWIGERVEARLATPVRLLDIGCGAGIAAEAFARRGFDVVGVDASGEAVAAAEAHAAGRGLALSYRVGNAEDLAAEGARFDVVTALEVIEHVADQAAFVRVLASLLAPNGLLFLSTINRTARSLAVAKIGAEYVARMLPIGTHDWRRFVPPARLAGWGRAAGLGLVDMTGMEMSALTGTWRATRQVGVNYLVQFATLPHA
ncbi:MAG TPA: bifunctional 2-polyprenyl-6-hydroxyphenol methylase/3-demethylubiquinol 3-O-methyltransferase UbiG [Acetobacteraceae bacterium]|nr:bifunctional 2-polyprenyl-6-hydroxyphenol methylase/3-demethylubiquinol 3-O-methyltransferase UbiG [Acetobacteraceae bacterium]